MATTTLKFCPLQSSVDVSFWSELGSKKLDEYQLSETPIDITGYLSASRHAEVASPLEVRSASFSNAAQQGSSGQQHQQAPAPGQLLLFNTLEAMRRTDKAAALQAAGRAIWADIVSGAAERQPQLLLRFLMLAYGDLKHFVFDYWFSFPALKPPQPFQQHSAPTLAAAFPQQQQQQLPQRICAAADAWRAAAASNSSSSSTGPDLFCLMRVDQHTGNVVTAPLAEWQQLTATGSEKQQGDAKEEVLLVMFDPCHLPLTPGWPLRNALLLAAARWRVRQLRVLCVRDNSAGRAAVERSYVLQVDLPELPDAWLDPAAAAGAATGAAAAAAGAPQAVGWEADAAGKLLPRRVDVSPLLSPVQLAEQAVDLNLRLMRWRAAPDLDISALAATRCLLLGAGTLGCAVARTLQAWGVRHITLLDSSRVSFSNPVRQSLFTFQDCLAGGQPKAQAAADALRAIFPSVVASGVALSIPMPGHPPANDQQEQQMQQATEQLAELVDRHDVIFLLTDTRESRWLPSLLAAAAGKLAITAALGFDNYVVMRHGLPPQATAADAAGSSSSAAAARLGCYFCNDVVAPLNSTIDRTLDQQCTVARPGLAPIAGALAVELMAAVLQHPLRGHAPAPGSCSSSSSSSSVDAALGSAPHMIRGQMFGFGQTCMTGQAFSQCTACSPAVLQQYRSQGWGFVRQVLSQPSLLEELTGLAELHRQAAAMSLTDSDDEAQEGAGQTAAAGAAAAVGEEQGGSEEEEDWTEL